MEPFQKRIRGYVQIDGTVPTICPSCGIEESLPPERVKTQDLPINVSCSCGATFSVIPEYRKAYRRSVTLWGSITKPGAEGEGWNILINNLSMTGLGFTLTENRRLAPGERLKIRFDLEDDMQTKIAAPAQVIHVSNDLVGCKFESLSSEEEEALANYLMLIP